MIVEQRTYTMFPGKAGDYLALYEKEGMAVQKRILGRMVGYYQTEIGDVNTVVHMWAYESFEERQAKRQQLFADPDWQAYIQKSRAFIAQQESTILKPAAFFSPQWQA